MPRIGSGSMAADRTLESGPAGEQDPASGTSNRLLLRKRAEKI
jgi:hypothetical protein